MRIVFISNFYNYHQEALSKELVKLTNDDFWFIETVPMSDQRKSMGWRSDECSYLIRAYESTAKKQKSIELINTADAIIIGSFPKGMIDSKTCKQSLFFKYSERVFKKPLLNIHSIKNALQIRFEWAGIKKAYLLAASAYAFEDYRRIGLFNNMALKWGYFPSFVDYDLNQMMSKKVDGLIVWCGRFIDWKHPEIAIEVSRRLKREGFSFRLSMIGDGNLKSSIEEKITEYDLQNEVELVGNVTPDIVRKYMEKAALFMLTSDKQEGWGVVLNEAMNSCCAVVANYQAGAVPYLIDNDRNGYVYNNGDIDDLYRKVKTLLLDQEKRMMFGKNAYMRIMSEWSAEVAAKRLVRVIDIINSGNKVNDIFPSGVCSEATPIKDKYESHL